MAGTLLLTVLMSTGCSTQNSQQNTQVQTTGQSTAAETEPEPSSAPETEMVSAAVGKVNYGAMEDTSIREEPIELTDEWDKVFPLSDEVNHRKVALTVTVFLL